jgi:dolichyl-phosphate-mannose--protein O-mannosyl transferase
MLDIIMDTQNHSLNINPLYIIAGSCSLVAGLAWNDAIQGVISEYLKTNNKYYMKILHSIITTIIVIIIIYILRSIQQSETISPLWSWFSGADNAPTGASETRA